MVRRTKWLCTGNESRLVQWAGSLARLGHLLDVQSNGTSVDWNGFRTWVFHKYSKAYAPTVQCYARNAHLLSGNLREDLLSLSVKNAAIKSLIILSKFLGIHQQFKQRLQDYGVKMARPDVFASFLRIYNNHNTDLLEWYSMESLKSL